MLRISLGKGRRQKVPYIKKIRSSYVARGIIAVRNIKINMTEIPLLRRYIHNES